MPDYGTEEVAGISTIFVLFLFSMFYFILKKQASTFVITDHYFIDQAMLLLLTVMRQAHALASVVSAGTGWPTMCAKGIINKSPLQRGEEGRHFLMRATR